MSTALTEVPDGGQHVEWSETLHSWLFRANVFLKRYWWIFILTVSGGVGWQAYVKYHTPVQWVSHSKMIVEGKIYAQVAGSSYVEESASFYPTQAIMMGDEQLQSKAIEETVINYPEYAANRPAVRFGIDREPNTSIFNLTAIGSDPLFTKYFLDAVMEAYTSQKKEERKQAVENAINQMTFVVQKNQDKVQEIQTQIEDFAKENTNVTFESLARSFGEQLSQMTTQRDDLQRQYNRLKAVNIDDYLSGKNVELVDQEFVGKGLLPAVMAQDYSKAKQDLLMLKAARDDRMTELKPAHPTMLEYETKVIQAQNFLQVQRRLIRAQLDDWLVLLQSNIVNANAAIVECQTNALKYNSLQVKYERLKADRDRAERTYEEYLKGVGMLDSSKYLDQGISLKIYRPASPSQKLEVSAMRQIGVGIFVGLVAGAALIFMLGVMDGRVMSVEDMTQRFEEPMLGIIPMQKRISGQVELLKSNDQRLMFAESCRNIRSSLLYMDRQGQRPRTIVLTSSIPNEGKSTISSNLAITLGFAASKTLLVDADLRRGQLHKRFGMDNQAGLAEHIQDGVPIDQVIRPTGFENLDFISCGKYPDQPGELLMSERFGETLKVLKQKYDFVVFDSPPILATDDAASFATRTDATIFVVRAGYTRLRQIRASLENLHRRGVNVYGLVVNFIDHREPGYYSYKYYDYYSYKAPARTA